MELHDLMIFKTVAQEGSISKAAKELGYVQPNVSERIKKLETELGKPLFHRSPKGVSILPSGEILLSYIDKIEELMDALKKEIKAEEAVYRIATTQSILSSYLSSRLMNHAHSYQLRMEKSSNLKKLLKEKQVDLVITYEDYSETAFEKVFSSTLPMALLTSAGKVSIDYSTAVFFVSLDHQCPFRKQTINFLREHQLSTKQIQEVDSYSLIQEFVAMGKGIAFLPFHNDKTKIIEREPVISLPIYFFTARSSEKPLPIEIFA